MKIALDAVGGDNGLAPNIDGALEAANASPELRVVLVGPAARLKAELSARGVGDGDPRFEIVDAPERVEESEEPAGACRAKPRSSIMVAMELAARREVAGVVSVGTIAAATAAALWHMKRVPGILRPAIATPVPNARGGVTVLLDAGANLDCKPWHLAQFGLMGALLARHLYGVAAPTVGLLTIGEEEGKGNDLVKEAFPLLKASGLDFRGAVEGRDIPAGKTDVVVCDGFTGNIALKTAEGMAVAALQQLKAELLSSWRYRLVAALLRGPFSRVKRRISYDEYGGAPLVGVNGVVMMCHGSSNARAVANALQAAARNAGSGLVDRLREAAERQPSYREEPVKI